MIALAVPLFVRIVPVGKLPFLVTVLLVVLSFVPFLVMSAVLMRVGQIVESFHAAYARRDIPEIARMKRLMEGSGPPANDDDRANSLLGDAELLDRRMDGRALLPRHLVAGGGRRRRRARVLRTSRDRGRGPVRGASPGGARPRARRARAYAAQSAQVQSVELVDAHLLQLHWQRTSLGSFVQ